MDEVNNFLNSLIFSVFSVFRGSSFLNLGLLFWHGKGEATAIRHGDWKLVFNEGKQKPEDPALTNGPALYHLKSDPLESGNLAKKHPEKVEALLDRAKTLLTDVYGNHVPIGTWPGMDPPEPPLKATDVWGRWIK